MADQNEKDIDILNSLIATTLDSINGYRESADDVDSSRFKEMFLDCAQDRQQVVSDLRAEVRRLGGEPEDDGTALAGAHRAFVNLKSAVTGQDDKAVVSEVERGEDHIKHKFEAALNDDDLSSDARQVVQKCYESVKRGHDKMSSLKHSLEA